MTNGNERELFEEYMKKEHPMMHLDRHEDKDSIKFDEYRVTWIEDMWESWQARSALSVCADGGKGEAVAWISPQELRVLQHNARASVSPTGMKDDEETIPLYNAPQAECAPRGAQPVTEILRLLSKMHDECGTNAGQDALWDAHEAVEQLLAAPTPERAPREEKPVAYMFEWPDGVSLALYNDAEQRYGEKPLRVIPLYAAPTPERAQPVARDKKLDRDLHSQLMNVAFAAFDGGYKCRPAKETVRTIVKALAAFYEKRAGSTPERADAVLEKLQELTMAAVEMRDTVEAFYASQEHLSDGGKGEAVAWMTDDGRVATDETKTTAMHGSTAKSFHIPLYAAPTPERAQESAGVLTDDQIREIWMRETGTTEQDSPLAILDFARAVLAKKEGA